jgi:hypothetical protein
MGAGRLERERHRQWEEQLERSREPKAVPEPAPKPAAPIAGYVTKDDLSNYYSKEVIHKLFVQIIQEKRALWQGRVGALEIQLDALRKGLLNADEH